jgi:hypothetical protein
MMIQDEFARFQGCQALPFDTEAWRQSLPYMSCEIDYRQPVTDMILLTDETAEYLYSDYTPTKARYETGTRPKLERHVAIATGKATTDQDKVLCLMSWTGRHVVIPQGVRPEQMFVGGTEEDVIERGFAYCNEASRVFVTLCQVAGIPARMSFHFTKDGRYGHACAEAYFGGAWHFCDADINVGAGGVPKVAASAQDLTQKQDVKAAFDEVVTHEMMGTLGMGGTGVKYSEVFCHTGICNYPIGAFPYKVRLASNAGPYE